MNSLVRQLCSAVRLGTLRLSLAFGLASALTASAEITSLEPLAHVPVLENGRIMPLDSFARLTLLSMAGHSTHNRKPAIDWLARVMFTPEDAAKDDIFLVNNPEVIEALGLPAQGRKRYSYEQLAPVLGELDRLARASFRIDQDSRSPVDKELISLFHNIITYQRLAEGFAFAFPSAEFDVANEELRRDLGLPAAPAGLSLSDLQRVAGRIDELAAAYKDLPRKLWTPYQKELFRLTRVVRATPRRGGESLPAIIPVSGDVANTWIGPQDIARAAGQGSEFATKYSTLLADMAVSFRAGKQVDFDLATRQFVAEVHKQIGDPKLARNLKREVSYNKADAFYRAEILYGLAFLFALFSVMSNKRWLRTTALALVILGLLPHTYGIVARMVIMGRPPVTNLYATFIFVGWVCVLIGLAVEYLQRNRLGIISASISGLALLLTSGRFATESDTMGVMVAVLDSNFWLATHVVTISIGYAGCCLAGLLGHIYLLQALRREPNDPALIETYNATYGALAFGLIFSFLGTMLGGVWADQSWGRFWGWDPKENGALVIVIWSAILFHAKMGGMIDRRGFAAGSVLGVIGVLCAWLGVNLLSVGLHSYGFTSGLARGLFIACMFEVVFVAATAPFARRATAKQE